jgi:hypothetical protein
MIALGASACVPVHDYSGDYDMTYDVVMSVPGKPGNVLAGLADVKVNKGLEHDYLIDMGTSLCRLQGRYIDAETPDGWPYLDIRPQPCWFGTQGHEFAMSLGGTAAYDHDDRFAIVLAGTYEDDAISSDLVGATRGTATVELTESW